MTDHRIETIHRYQAGATDYYELSAEHGYTDLTYHNTSRWLGVANIFVEPAYRRQGLGRAMLERTIEFAHQKEAKLLHAALISRESIAAFTSVFGEDSVKVRYLGTFAAAGKDVRRDASAAFRFEL